MNKIDIQIKPQARILIVDDEPLIRKILSKYLGEKNYYIETADDGQNAMQKLDHDRFDLVLTDLRMPNMGGRELLQTMSDRFPDIPKIVLTGYGTNEDIILALKTGAYDFLTKPITDFTILEHSIERAIERKRLSDEKNRYIEQLKQINEIISMLNRGKSTEDIFNTLNIILRKVIPFNRLTLATIQKGEEVITTKLVASDRKIILGTDSAISLRESSLKTVSDSKQVLNISNLKEYYDIHPSSRSSKLLMEEGMMSSLVLPLIVNDLTRGFLIFGSEEADAFNDEHITFLESIVGQISLSIQRGELLYEIEQHTKNLEDLVDRRTQELLKTQKTTIFALSRLAETRDTETGNHLERMRNYSVLLAQILKYEGKYDEITNRYLRDLYDSSILHDIGKVGIPDMILLKDSFLNETEMEVMKSHTIIGYDALKSASKDLGDDSFLKMAMDVTRSHHEQWDGNGYPDGLKGKDIPLAARIVAIADVYDALTSRRPYKDAYSHEESVKIMMNERYRFDPDIFDAFINNAIEFNKIKNRFNSD
ncbi:MAG TPA: response regulator [Spirochaetota bacterium]|nr:response regulator [Spirochaetota bacterium]HPI88346.1 response regulator [Spirochaetota bacterium]HPR46796.1 response regulator [Spirochaetota bacterium]